MFAQEKPQEDREQLLQKTLALLRREFPENDRILQFARGVYNIMDIRLPENLPFHNLGHTFHPQEGVFPQYMDYATIMQVSAEEKEEGAIASIGHDEGFIHEYFKNEKFAVKDIRLLLLFLGYASRTRDQVGYLIEDTDPFRIPRTMNAKLLADADKDNMGRPDGLVKTINLYEESIYQNEDKKGQVVDTFKGHYKFFKSQEFFSEAAEIKGRPRIKALNEDTLEVFIQELQRVDEEILYANPVHVARATLQQVYKMTNFNKRVGEFRILEAA